MRRIRIELIIIIATAGAVGGLIKSLVEQKGAVALAMYRDSTGWHKVRPLGRDR